MVNKLEKYIIDNQEIDYLPFSSICPLPIPHKFHGMSVADTVKDVQ